MNNIKKKNFKKALIGISMLSCVVSFVLTINTEVGVLQILSCHIMLFFFINFIYLVFQYGNVFSGKDDLFKLSKKYHFNKTREETNKILNYNLKKGGYSLIKKSSLNEKSYCNIYARVIDDHIEIVNILNIKSLTQNVIVSLKKEYLFVKEYISSYKCSEVIFIFCSEKLNNNLKSFISGSDYDFGCSNYHVLSNAGIIFDSAKLYIMNISGGRFQNIHSKAHFKRIRKKIFALLEI